MASARGLTLLHLSDLHFGEHHNFAEEGVASLLARVGQDADRGDSAGPLAPDLVLVTGDLTYHAFPSEFRVAEAFLVGVAERFELERRRVVIVPGNHDVSWAKCRSYFDDCASNEEEPVWPYWPKWRNFVDFVRRFYGDDEAASAFIEPQPWTFHDFPELATAVAGLNSTMAETHRDGEHYGFVGEAQLRAFESKLAEAAGRGYLRIAALHHDVLAPVDPRSREDSKDLRRILGPSLNLVVHGHQHEGEITWLGGATPIFGIGSAGVTRERRPAEVPNQYEWIRIFADRFEVGGRSWSTGQKRFVDDVTIDPQGRSGWISQQVAFTGISTFAARDRAELSAVASAAFDEERRARGIDRYREHLVRTLDPLPLSSMASRGRDHGLVVRLRQVFVAQSAEIEWPRGDLAETEGGDGEEQEDEERKSSLDRRAHKRPEAMADVRGLLGDPRRRWLFVMGAPGAGKTSLVRWICTSPEALASPAGARVPVLIELSRFHKRYEVAKGATVSPYTFFDFLAEQVVEHHGSLSAGDFEVLAEQGRLFWCFDGLDEVPDERARLDIFERIQSLTTAYPGCGGLVTCRVAAAELFRGKCGNDVDVDERIILPCRLLPFNRIQIDAFLDRWHDVVFAGEPEVGAHRRRRLAEALDRSPALAELAGTPLLLTLLAVLNRGQELPSQRHELYREFLALMAERWDANKHQRIADRFGIATKLRYLREVAWAMIEASGEGSPRSWLPEDELFRFTADFCRREFGVGPEEAAGSAEALLRQIRERDFILAWRGDGAYCFVHKAIFEYCAATEICERFGAHRWSIEDVADLAASRWRDESWGEILRIVGGILAEREPSHAVRMIQGAWRSAKPCSRNDVLALTSWSVRCVAGFGNLDAAPLRGVLRCLGAIVEHIWRKILFVDIDWFSLWRVGGRFPNRRKIHSDLLSRSANWVVASDVLRLAAAFAPERADFLALAAGAKRPDDYAAAIEALSDLGPWSGDELLLLSRVACSAKTNDALVRLASCGVGEARCRLQDQIGSGGAQVLAEILSYRKLNRAMRDEAEEKVLEYARFSPVSLLGVSPVWLMNLLSGGALSEVAAAVARALKGESADGTVSGAEHYEEWLGQVLIMSRDVDLFAVWSDRLTLDGPSAGWVDVLGRLVEVGWSPACELLDVIARDCLSYGFCGSPRSLARFFEIVRGPLPVMRLLEKAAFRHSDEHGRGVVLDAVISRGGEVSDEQFRELIGYVTRGAGIGDVDLARWFRREGKSVHPVVQRWLLSLAEAEAEGNLRLVASLVDDPLRISYVSNRLSRLQKEDFLAYADALNDIKRLDLLTSSERVMLAEVNSNISFIIRLHFAYREGDVEVLRRLVRLPTVPQEMNSHTLDRLRFRQRQNSLPAMVWEIALDDLITALLREGLPRRAEVRLRGRLVGHLEESPTDNTTRFTYHPDYLATADALPISPTLPLRPEPYERRGLHPFFAGLLPQGWLHENLVDKYHLRESDEFGLLLATGADTIGAVEVVPVDEDPRARYRQGHHARLSDLPR